MKAMQDRYFNSVMLIRAYLAGMLKCSMAFVCSNPFLAAFSAASSLQACHLPDTGKWFNTDFTTTNQKLPSMLSCVVRTRERNFPYLCMTKRQFD